MKGLKSYGYVAIGLLLVLGRYPISKWLSSRRKILKPREIANHIAELISCTSGNDWHLVFDGPADAEPVVMIHGLNASIQHWFYQRIALRENYRLILLDLPGHGRSPIYKNLSIDVLAADLKEILDITGTIKPVLYGHSIGAMIIMKFCINNPDSGVKGVVLQHGSFTHPLNTAKFNLLAKLLEEPIIKPFMKFAKRNYLAFQLFSWVSYMTGLNLFLYRYLLFSGSQTPAQLRFIGKLAARTPPQVVAEGVLRILEFDVKDYLYRIAVPALVICAKNDTLFRPWAGRILAENVQRGQFALVDGGHQSMMEYAEQTNLLVSGFLKGMSGENNIS